MRFVDKDLLSVQEARILMENAGEARNALSLFPQEKLDRILESMLAAAEGHLKELAGQSREETGYGSSQDKYRKNRMIWEQMSCRLKDMRCVGLVEENTEEGTAKIGVPMGTIVALIPATSPVSTTLYIASIAVKSGNAVVFAPHPRAERTVQKTVKLLAEAACAAGLPEGGIACPDTVTKEGTIQMMAHSETTLIINTGVPQLLDAPGTGNKPLICGGIGPSPVFIERTADVSRAVKDIIDSRSFDCGTSAGAEQYVVADYQIADEVKKEMIRMGAYFMDEKEEGLLMGLLCPGQKEKDPEYMGKPAVWLAERAGFTVPGNTRVLVSQQQYISDFNPYAKALLCPVLVFYIEKDWMFACEKCIELLESCGHTLAIHSRDEEVIRQFMLKKPVGRILINTPAAFGAMGITTNLFPAMTLGGLTAGLGITSDNVSPMNLVYLRSAARGVREWGDGEISAYKEIDRDEHMDGTDVSGLLRMILEQLEQ